LNAPVKSAAQVPGTPGRDRVRQFPAVSYDLAVWEGDQPESDEAALTTYRELCDRYLEVDLTREPTPRIKRYAEALLARWPDIDDPAGDSSPWASAPLIEEAIGPVMYFPMVHSRAYQASAFAATLAWAHGLVCFDPQQGALRTPALDAAQVDRLIREGQATQVIAEIRDQLGCPLPDATGIYHQRAQLISDPHPPATVLTTPSGRTINNPSRETVHQALTQLGSAGWYAILERPDGWYVQVGVGAQAGTRPGGYALERQDGGPSQHYRTIVIDLSEVIAAFTGFAGGDPNWSRRFAWQPYQL
jgi:hypothetical protein